MNETERKAADEFRAFHRFIWAQYLSQKRELHLLNKAILKKNRRIKGLQKQIEELERQNFEDNMEE